MKAKQSRKFGPATILAGILHLSCSAGLLAGLFGALASGWGAEADSGAGTSPALRVGITPEYPPLVFRQPEGTNGAEIDFAKALGTELQRPVQFVVLRWDELIPALVDQRIDIIMSGMSITKARQLRVAFSEPYLHNQLRALFPLKNAARFKTVEDLCKTDARIGVVAGTTGEVFAKQNCTNAQLVPITMRRDIAVHLLSGNRMDAFIDDTFALADIYSQNPADLSYLPQALADDDLAWGVRPGDQDLLVNVNRILAQWKANGTLDRILDRWLPYRNKLTATQRQARNP